MKHIICSVLAVFISILMLASCSMNFTPQHETESGNDVVENNTSIEGTKDIIGETNPEENNHEEEHNQGGGYMGDELYPLYTPLAGILSVNPGDDTFMVTKAAEVAMVSEEYMNLYTENRSTLPPLVYYVIHELDLTREEIEYYYRNSNVSTEYIDAFFVDDVETAKELLKSQYAFQIGECTYNIYEIQQMASEKSISRELQAYMNSDEFKEVIENINDYLDDVDPFGIHYEASVFTFVESHADHNITN